MAFVKRIWKARIGTGLNRFRINGGTPQTLVNAPESIAQEGDALSADNLNDLEDRIEAACPRFNIPDEEETTSSGYLLNIAVGSSKYSIIPLYTHLIRISVIWASGNNLAQCISLTNLYKDPLTNLTDLMYLLNNDFSALPEFMYFQGGSGGTHRRVWITGLDTSSPNSYCYCKTQADSDARREYTFSDKVVKCWP